MGRSIKSDPQPQPEDETSQKTTGSEGQEGNEGIMSQTNENQELVDLMTSFPLDHIKSGGFVH